MEFDATKEAVAIIHHIDGEGKNFKLLGPVFDPKLLMHPAVKKMVSKARPKMIALLRTKRYYSTRDMIKQFKAHLLCVLESCNAAIYHASDTALAPLNRVMNTSSRNWALTPIPPSGFTTWLRSGSEGISACLVYYTNAGLVWLTPGCWTCSPRST